MSWDDLYAFIFASPPGSAVFHAVEQGWTTSDYLLAHVVDALNVNNWQRTEGASKKPPRGFPDPFPRPGDKDKQSTDPQVGDTVSFGSGVATVTTVGDFLERRAEREQRWRDKHQRGGGD